MPATPTPDKLPARLYFQEYKQQIVPLESEAPPTRRSPRSQAVRKICAAIPSVLPLLLPALWADNSSGAIVKDPQTQGDKGLLWVPADGGTPVALPEAFQLGLRWRAN